MIANKPYRTFVIFNDASIGKNKCWLHGIASDLFPISNLFDCVKAAIFWQCLKFFWSNSIFHYTPP